LQQAAEQFRKTLTIDSEDVTAHYSLALLYRELEDDARADEHQQLHERYREDNQARGVAVGKARERYPAANHAAESLVIYSLTRFGAPELPALDSSSLTSAEVR
jgi:hypothetical protein